MSIWYGINWYYVGLRIRRLIWPDIPAEPKLLAEQFGGGKVRGEYTDEEVKQELCSKRGCGRYAGATWSGCADGNIMRPLCWEHDIELNRMVQEWWGDDNWEQKVVDYANDVQDNRAERPLELDWMLT